MFSALLIAVVCSGCLNAGRLGSGAPPRVPPPSTACERQGFYEVVPAYVEGVGSSNHVVFTRTITVRGEGIGVFKYGAEQPSAVEDLWASLEEPELARIHQVPIDAVDDAHARSLWWGFGGLAVMIGGVVTAGAVQDSDPTAAAVTGLSGVALGIVGLVFLLIEQPSAKDQAYASVRRHLFLEGEDDLQAVDRGIARMNERRVRECHSR